MCTIVLAARIFDSHPLVVVANRDEELARASSPPLLWPPPPGTASQRAMRFVAPRDEVAGGTWLGVNEAGVFVGITNRFLGPKDPSRLSRGALVTEALALGSARAIHEAMAAVPASRHNGFHLVYADAHDVLATASNGAHIAQVDLGRGLHMITERSFGAGDDTRRRARIQAAWDTRTSDDGRSVVDPGRLSSLLTDHDEADPLAATCIHIPSLGYGSRSSATVAITRDPAESQMLWAEGPPCTTPFVPVPLKTR